ncbi:MAG: tetraacyldisaccharide 4'-kinase [Myxococcota bacterium]
MNWESLWYGPPTWRSAVLAPLLAPLSWAYAAGVAARDATFSLGLRRPVRIDGATVVSVGNVVVGGAGKTPVTIFLARWARACGRTVAVLSRGYGRANVIDSVHFSASNLPPVEQVGDEPRLIARRAPGVEVCVAASRAEAGLAARRRGADFLILDDGFQHRQLHRDVDLVVLSEVGNGHRLPWGPLREGPAALARATLLVGGDGASGAPVQAKTVVSCLVDARGQQHPLDLVRGRAVVLLTGIARPWRVTRTLESLGAQVVDVQAYADHHPFTSRELELAVRSAERHAALVITTEKDRERLPESFEAFAPRLDLELTQGLDALALALGLDKGLVPTAQG